MPTPTSVSKLSNVPKLREALVTVLWRQWDAVGAMASVSERAASIVDPEALILMSLSLVKDEPRFADLAASWVILNSDLLSVQRIKNLAPVYPVTSQELLGGLAAIACKEGKDFRWRELSKATNARVLQYRTNKIRAVRVPLEFPPALMLRIRAAFGVGVRSDILTYLLGINNESRSVREISEAIGYTDAPTRRAVDDLVSSSLIDSAQGRSGTILYSASSKRWGGFLEIKAVPVWREWHGIFSFSIKIFDLFEKAKKISEHIAINALSRELLEQYYTILYNLNVPVEPKYEQQQDISGYLNTVVGNVAERISIP